ncbi:hypothetical protein V1291_002138 [Nitrobacteraceae bacterium AZCC 1564]
MIAAHGSRDFHAEGSQQKPATAIVAWWRGFDIRYLPGRELVKRMSNLKLH